ncbi:tetratricopeptide repeat protein [Planctomycetota bacterium]
MLGLLVSALFAFEMSNYDIWWHLATGRHILEHWALPATDPFSYGAGLEKPWLIISWLFAPLAYLIHSSTGVFGLVAVKGLLGTLCCAALLLRCRLHLQGSASPTRLLPGKGGSTDDRPAESAGHLGDWLLPLLIVILGAFAMRERFMVRPHTVGFLCLSLHLLLLDLFVTRKRWWLVPLLLNQILWVNLHPSFMVGLPVAFLYVLGEARARRTSPRFARACVALLAGAVCVLANPDHLARPLYIVQMFFTQQLQEVREYGALSLGSASPLQVVFLALAALALVLCAAQRRYTQAALIVLFGWLGISSMRFFSMLVIATVPLLPAVTERHARPLTRRLRQHPRLRSAIAIAFAALLVGIAARSRPAWGFGVSPFVYPERSVDYVQRMGFLERGNGRIFNSYNFGGYLIWRLHPRRKVFIDGRVHLFYGEPLSRYLLLAKRPDQWHEIVNRQNLDLAIVRYPNLGADGKLYNDTSRLFAGDTWVLLYMDDVAIVYARADTLSPRERRELPFRLLDPQRLDPQYLCPQLQSRQAFGALMGELDRAMSLAPRSYRLHFLRAWLFAQIGRHGEAIADLKQCLEINPDVENARRILRVAYGIGEL